MTKVRIQGMTITDGKDEYEFVPVTQKELEKIQKDLRNYSGHGSARANAINQRTMKEATVVLNWNMGWTAELFGRMVDVK